MSDRSRDWESGYADGVRRGVGCARGSLETMRGRLAAMRRDVDELEHAVWAQEKQEADDLEAQTESYRVGRVPPHEDGCEPAALYCAPLCLLHADNQEKLTAWLAANPG